MSIKILQFYVSLVKILKEKVNPWLSPIYKRFRKYNFILYLNKSPFNFWFEKRKSKENKKN